MHQVITVDGYHMEIFVHCIRLDAPINIGTIKLNQKHPLSAQQFQVVCMVSGSYGPVHLWPIFGSYGPYINYIVVAIIPWRWY